MNRVNEDRVVKAIEKAAKEAAERGVEVSVEIVDNGFFPTEKTRITIVATPPKKG